MKLTMPDWNEVHEDSFGSRTPDKPKQKFGLGGEDSKSSSNMNNSQRTNSNGNGFNNFKGNMKPTSSAYSTKTYSRGTGESGSASSNLNRSGIADSGGQFTGAPSNAERKEKVSANNLI